MKRYACYLHKQETLVPEIRFVTVDDEPDLPEAISQMLSTWPRFQVLEVCDDSGEPMFRISPEGAMSKQ